jgi:hypothetical protein
MGRGIKNKSLDHSPATNGIRPIEIVNASLIPIFIRQLHMYPTNPGLDSQQSMNHPPIQVVFALFILASCRC